MKFVRCLRSPKQAHAVTLALWRGVDRAVATLRDGLRVRPRHTLGAGLEKEILAFEESDRARPPAVGQTLFVGSSSFAAWSTLSQDIRQPAINRGFGGSTIADINAVFDRIVLAYRPSAIVFYAGENDIALGATPDQVVERFSAFMHQKVQKLGSTPVYFVSIKPSPDRAAQRPRQAEVNEVIRVSARSRRDLIFIDVVTAMDRHGETEDLYLADGIHLDARAYDIWAEVVNRALTRTPVR